ncbi:unnamed protein product, partial [Rotaria sordida]
HGRFFFRDASFTFDIFALSTLDDRLITDGLLLVPAEKESRDKFFDDLSTFPDEEWPLDNRFSNDYKLN